LLPHHSHAGAQHVRQHRNPGGDAQHCGVAYVDVNFHPPGLPSRPLACRFSGICSVCALFGLAGIFAAQPTMVTIFFA